MCVFAGQRERERERERDPIFDKHWGRVHTALVWIVSGEDKWSNNKTQLHVRMFAAVVTDEMRQHLSKRCRKYVAFMSSSCQAVVEQQHETKTNSVCSRMHVAVRAAIDHSQHRTAAS